MPPDMQKQVAPLLWLLPVSAVLVAIVVASAWLYSQPIESAIRLIIAEHTMRILSPLHTPAETRVLGIGTSLLQAASPGDYRLQQLPNHDLTWARTINYGFGLGRMSGILPVVEQYPPDVLVVDQNLFFPSTQDDLMDGARNIANLSLRKWMVSSIASLDPLQVERAMQTEDFSCSVGPNAHPSEKQILAHVKQLQTFYQTMWIEPDLQATLTRLARRGVRIMILDIQRSMFIESKIKLEKQDWLMRLQQVLPPSNNISYHTAPSYAPSSLYCDGAHLSSAGRKLFEAWWWQELRQVQKSAT